MKYLLSVKVIQLHEAKSTVISCRIWGFEMLIGCKEMPVIFPDFSTERYERHQRFVRKVLEWMFNVIQRQMNKKEIKK